MSAMFVYSVVLIALVSQSVVAIHFVQLTVLCVPAEPKKSFLPSTQYVNTTTDTTRIVTSSINKFSFCELRIWKSCALMCYTLFAGLNVLNSQSVLGMRLQNVTPLFLLSVLVWNTSQFIIQNRVISSSRNNPHASLFSCALTSAYQAWMKALRL